MKGKVFKILTLLIILALSATLTYSQTPQGFSYQAVIRDGNGTPIVNRDISLQITLQSSTGTPYYTEKKVIKTSAQGIVNHTIGLIDNRISGSFATIPWGSGNVYIKVEVDPNGGSAFTQMGDPSKLQSVPYALYAENTKEIVSNPNAQDDDPIFEVKNKSGQVVFGVYQGGVRVYVEDTQIKGAKGGFAIGGLTNQAKYQQEYFRITPDSARLWVKEVPTVKGAKGGFAIGGLTNQTKAASRNLMFVASDSTRIYIDDSNTSKGAKGGFAIGGLTNQSKGGDANFFNISTDTTGIINPSENRVLWYPLKNAFLAGRVLIVSPDSVGTNSMATGFESKAIGDYTQALGYKARAFGNSSTAIGNYANAVGYYSLALGNNAYAEDSLSYAMGNFAKTQNVGSYALGSHAQALGKSSFAMGSVGINNDGSSTDPTIASGDYSYAFGMGSLASGKLSFAFGGINNATGEHSIAIGYGTASTAINSVAIGLNNNAIGPSSFALGNYTYASGVFSTTLGNATSANGLNATAMGFETTAIGDFSTVIGRKLWAYGNHSIAIGSFSTAYGEGSLALGNYTYAKGVYSTTMGNATKANGLNSTAMGYSTIAKGDYSTVMGIQAKAKAYASVAIGMYNDTTCNSSTSWISTDPLFICGNGNGTLPNSNALTLYKNGNLTISGTLTQSSDIRLKEDITPFISGVDLIKKFNPVYFFYKDKNAHPGGRQIGLIAQEVNELVPELVQTDGRGFFSVDYSKLSVVLLQTVKEQQQQIENTNIENQQLKLELQTLKDEVAQIKAMLKK